MSCKRRKTSPVRLVYLSSEVVTPSSRLPVELLWIDGDHRYSAVRRDFEPWEPHLRGKVSFHDAIQESLGPFCLTEKLLAYGFELLEQATKALRRRAEPRFDEL
jgi:hypothetical protein